MSAWDEYYGGGGSSPAVTSSGGRNYGNAGVGMSSSGGLTQPPLPGSGGGRGGAAQSSERPGVINVNPLDPGSLSTDPISQLFNGLRQGIIGNNETKGSVNKSILGGVPLLGPLLGGVANAIGGVGEVLGGAIDATGGFMERAGVPDAEHLDTQYEEARTAAMQTENGRKMVAELQAAIDKEQGVFGTGLLDNDGHLKSAFLREWRKEEAFTNPSLNPGAFTAPGSLADELQNLFDVLEVSAAVAAKGWAGLGTPGQGGMNRLESIMAVGNGEIAFNEDKGVLGTGLLAGDSTTGLNAMEKLVYEKVKAGDWTDDEAKDFLASNGQAFGHSALVNIGGSLALDPLNIATAGAGMVAKVGARGAVILSKAGKAGEALASAARVLEESQLAMKTARVGGKGVENLSYAKKALAAAKADVEQLSKSVESLKAYSGGDASAIRKANFIARSVEGSERTTQAFKFAGRLYGGLEGNSLGKAAKVTRTIIDPLHALDLNMPGANKMVEIFADSVPASIADTLGVHHYKGMLDESLRLDPTRGMYNQLSKDFGVAASNMARGGLVDMFRGNQIAGRLTEKLMKTLPGDVYETALATTKHKDLQKWLRYNALKHVQVDTWDKAAHETLAKTLARTYGTRSEADWLKAFETMSKEQKSMYKFAAYGNANRRLIELTNTMDPAVAALLPVPPQRMVLLAKGTLTRVIGEAELTKLSKPGLAPKAKLKLIVALQEKYPSLRYVSIDPKNVERSMDKFIESLDESLPKLPMQLTTKEIGTLGTKGDDLMEVAGEYRLGFRPEDEFLWGLERNSATGLYHPQGQAWADHVADGAAAYRPAAYLRLNLAGHPVVGIPVARAAIRAVDHIDSAARLMKTQVSGAMVHEAARKRFVHLGSTRLAEHGVNETVANKWFERIIEYTKDHKGYSGPRGMGGDDLYKAIKEEGLIPQSLMSGDRRLRPEDVMLLVLQAYDGDLRYIGLTQKLSSRVKSMASLGGTHNFAGQIAEHVWPTVKFRMNPLFQMQEKVEPWVLNAMRGVSFATGATLSEADLATDSMLKRLIGDSLNYSSDMYEQSADALATGLRKTATDPASRLNAIQKVGHFLGDVQGMKRVNALRTFRKGLGKEMKAAWEGADPGAWDKMKDSADIAAGRILKEDDFALQLVSEQAFASDIFTNRVLAKHGKFTNRANDFRNAIKPGAWHTPQNLGELRQLDLDHMAESLVLVNAAGKDIKNLEELRAALAVEPDMMEKVTDGLKALGAHEDYIRRTRNALNFSWTGFWKTAEKRFGLTGDESRRLQDMMAGAAEMRDMTPVEFMSQVWSPMLREGTEGALGSIEGTARILRNARAAGRKMTAKDAKLAESRTILAGKEGVSTREDFVRQLSQTFSAHLDPSAKRALLLEFRPELRKALKGRKVKLDFKEVNEMWDDLAESQLADRILGYMDGKMPTHAADELDDTRGLLSVRQGADGYMAERGVTSQAGRSHFVLNPEAVTHYEEGARHFAALPDVEYLRTGRIPKSSDLSKSGVDLKPRPKTVDQRTYRSYEAFVQDTSSQYEYLTRSKAKGGMGLRVTVSRTEPYTADAAGRAAMNKDIEKGVLRVFGGDSDHALMSNEQNVMFRAVHDVFGHAAEGFEFGPRGELNAAAKHARMYGNEGRPAMLTETHGQNSYVNYSDDIYAPTDTFVPTALDAADPVADFERRFPFAAPDSQPIDTSPLDPMDASDLRNYPDYVEGAGTVNIFGRKDMLVDKAPDVARSYTYTQRIGKGLRALPADQQAAILQPLADLFDEFPNLRVHHIDVVDLMAPIDPDGWEDVLLGTGLRTDAYAVTWGADRNESIILFNSSHLERAGANWSAMAKTNELQSQYDSFNRINPITGMVEDTPRWSNKGANWTAGNLDIAQVARHEAFHAYDVARRPHRPGRPGSGVDWVQESRSAADDDYHEMMVRFESAAGRLDLSEYGMTNSAEFAAELGSYSTNPDLIVANIRSQDLREMVEEYQQFLKDSGEWVPRAPAVNSMAGKTIREVNAIKRGTAYAPQKAGLLPQEYIDSFMERYVGRSKHIESNPDVARTAQMFGKWTDGVITNGLLRGENSVHGNLLQDIAGIPTGEAVPYNYTEAATVNLAMESMKKKWDDAFRLQYFSQERSFFERSLNHPMFGMYPASYMWGKILPEMVRTIALNPFGVRTGGAARSLLDIQGAITMRREFDSEFDAKIEELGHSQALSFLGYLLPAVPWEVSASAAGWAQAVAEQGLRNFENPGKEKDISVADIGVSAAKKLAPLTTSIPWATRALGEVGDAIGLGGDQTAEERATENKALQAHQQAVRASELQPTLTRIMQELQNTLR